LGRPFPSQNSQDLKLKVRKDKFFSREVKKKKVVVLAAEAC
jgi:hypothetical protein